MQTEIRHRLLAPDALHTSGYRIVGYLHSGSVTADGDCMIDMPVDPDGNGPLTKTPPHTAREQGVYVLGKWYYEGDLVVFNDSEDENTIGMIRYYYTEWFIKHPDKAEDIYDLWHMVVNTRVEVIGTIHDEMILRHLKHGG